MTLLRVVCALVALVTVANAVGRWHPDSPEERWAVILAPGARLPPELVKLGRWRVAGAAHRSLNSTHLVLARPRGAKLDQGADPINWPGVQVAHLLVPRARQHRGLIEDVVQEPLWAKQWHLHDFEFPASFTPPMPAHISAVSAWLDGATGEGVQVAVVDDGLQSRHPDLSGNFDAEGSYDFNFDSPNVEPTSRDAHGTEASGTACAGVNAACGSGVAPMARVAGIRLLAQDTVTDEQEALSLSYQDQRNDIFSNSWGPFDDGQRLEGPGVLTRAAMAQSIREGRDGKGSIYVWAAGNGRTSNDNCNFDGYANSRYTITVPAVTSMGIYSYYSEDCSANLICAPSSGAGDNPYKIVTTDLMGTAGQSLTDCASTFGGTSAAAPVVAGVVALLLSARPDLGWRDVQGVLIHSTDSVDPASASWHMNGGGMLFSHTYGFGRVNASRAVQLAREWPLYPIDVEIVSANTSFASGASTSVVSVTNNIRVESVSVTFTTRVARRGKLAIRLYSPSGMLSYLAPPHPDTNANIYEWSFGSVAHWEEPSKGNWTLELTADNSLGQWSGASWVLHVFGHVDPTLNAAEATAAATAEDSGAGQQEEGGDTRRQQ